MKKLIIAEKPSLAKTIIRGIGENDNFKDYFDSFEETKKWCKRFSDTMN